MRTGARTAWSPPAFAKTLPNVSHLSWMLEQRRGPGTGRVKFFPGEKNQYSLAKRIFSFLSISVTPSLELSTQGKDGTNHSAACMLENIYVTYQVGSIHSRLPGAS